ncbi:hypothetical protein ABTX61_14670 [Amycolatopsis japonica]|uniref:hypothetical protein n=1 Tax=Amycolatopsis japonica TaxID=208439 RepID=UPI003322D779
MVRPRAAIGLDDQTRQAQCGARDLHGVRPAEDEHSLTVPGQFNDRGVQRVRPGATHPLAIDRHLDVVDSGTVHGDTNLIEHFPRRRPRRRGQLLFQWTANSGEEVDHLYGRVLDRQPTGIHVP